MTDRDDRINDAKICQFKVSTPEFLLDQHPLSCSLGLVELNETNTPIITNTDSEGDYETSSEGPHSSRPEFHQPRTTFVESSSGNVIPESNQSLLVNAAFFQEDNFGKKNDPSASYTIIGNEKSPRTNVTSKITDSLDQTVSASSCSEIESPLNGLEEFETRRTEYFMASRIESDATKSESLPVITIATPWGSYEYPDVHMPAERLVSDSQVDIKEKMRIIAACMDGSNVTTPRMKFFEETKPFLHSEVEKDELKSEDGEIIPKAEWKIEKNRPRTPKMIAVTSPRIFSEPFNVLPIIRNPDLGSDYTFPPSPSGSSSPVTVNNNATSIFSSFYHRASPSPQNSIPKKSSFDPLSRIEGELAPLQNELSEIRGKVRALNLDYNLSCINGTNKFPNTMSWINGGKEIGPVKDDFIRSDFHTLPNQRTPFNATRNIGVLNFRGTNQPRYQFPFTNQSLGSFSYSHNLDKAENQFETAEPISDKNIRHPGVATGSNNCEPEIEEIRCESPSDTDRNLSPVYICTSRPSSVSSKDKTGSAESEGETESSEEKETFPEIQLPNFLDKIRIVPIAYLGGMPDPPAEPIFNFAKEKNIIDYEISHKVLRIEHPDTRLKRQEENVKTSLTVSDTVMTLDSETENSLSTTKEDDNSSIENYPRLFEITSISKFEKKSSSSHYSVFTDQQEKKTRERTYIRGLISGPEDFL